MNRSSGRPSKPQPAKDQAPVVQKVRLRYAKRGPLRFTSHRDFARALERALRRARVPVAYSQGFTPHPKISYASAAPTGAASEAEYLELGLQEQVDPQTLVRDLDAVLAPGLDIEDAVVASAGGSFADRMAASRWRLALPDVSPDTLGAAVAALEAADTAPVERVTKQGRRTLDVRAALVSATVPPESPPSEVTAARCAILESVVRQQTPTVRPEDVLSSLRVVAQLTPPAPAQAVRLAQGPLTAEGEIVDPLAADRGGGSAT